VDDRHGLIVHSEVVNDNNDLGQFAEQMDQANTTLEQPCQAACADAGFANAKELEKTDAQDIEAIIPSAKHAQGQTPGPFDKSRFRYDGEADVCLCPDGHPLSFRYIHEGKGKRGYYTGSTVCRNCRQYGVCTRNATTGRQIIHYENEAVRERLATH